MSKSRARMPADKLQAKRTWSDESLAPAIDEQLLQKLVRRELPEAKARALYRFVHSFESWNGAYNRLLIDEERRTSKRKG